MEKSVKQLADELLAQGFAKFVGDGITVEIATRIQPADHDSPRELGGWKEWRIVGPKDTTTRAVDYAVESLRNTEPGSTERISAMAELYSPVVAQLAGVVGQELVEPTIQPTAFPIDLEALADRLAHTLVGKGGSNAPSQSTVRKLAGKFGKKLAE